MPNNTIVAIAALLLIATGCAFERPGEERGLMLDSQGLTRADRVEIAWSMASEYGAECMPRHACHIPATVCAADTEPGCIEAVVPAIVIAYAEHSFAAECATSVPTVSERCGDRWALMQ